MPEPSPRVSVLMAVKDGAPLLGEAIQSILDQTLRDLELVVVDDGSTDATPRLLAEAARRDPRVRVLRWANRGLTAALNRGLLECRAPLIARQDADDRSHPERLERQVAFLEAHPEVVLLGTGCRLLGHHRRAYGERRPPAADPALAAALRRRNVLIHTSVVLRASAVAALGGYDPRFRCAQDYDLWLRLLDHGLGANLPEPLVDLHQGAGRVSGRSARAQARAALRAKLKNRHGRILRGASPTHLLPDLRSLVLPPGLRNALHARIRG